ncbi:MAG: PAS domain-containing protein [Methylophilaceae bacterium]
MATLLLANQAGENAALMTSEKSCTGADDSMAVLTLSGKGMIRECNEAAGRLFGCQSGQLIWQHISVLLPQLAETVLIQDEQINPRLRFLSRIGHRFEVTGPDGTGFTSKLFLRCVENSGRRYLRVIFRPAGE